MTTADLQAAIRSHHAGPISARALARRAGIDTHTAADIIAGRRASTTLRVADRICTALGIHLDMLVTTGPPRTA